MKRSNLITWFRNHSFDVLESNGIIWIRSASGAYMVLRSRIYYSRLWLLVHFWAYQEMWTGNWKKNYKSCMVHASITSNN